MTFVNESKAFDLIYFYDNYDMKESNVELIATSYFIHILTQNQKHGSQINVLTGQCFISISSYCAEWISNLNFSQLDFCKLLSFFVYIGHSCTFKAADWISYS